MTPDKLRKINDAYHRAAALADELKDERRDAITAAVTAGMTHAQIAEALGLSRGRINQLRRRT